MNLIFTVNIRVRLCQRFDTTSLSLFCRRLALFLCDPLGILLAELPC